MKKQLYNTRLKTLTIIAVMTLSCSIKAMCQQIFNNAWLDNIHDRCIINFTVTREANVFNYKVEGSNDSTAFTFISTIPSKGNTVLQRSYHYELFGQGYIFYRICMVGMDRCIKYSKVISTKKHVPQSIHPDTLPVNASPAAIGKR